MSLRAARVRFYVDADVLGLGKILVGLRNDVTYRRPRCRHPQTAAGTPYRAPFQ